MSEAQTAKGPSKEAKDAVGNVISIIEGLNPQDRGYLLNRLSQVYFGGKSAKDLRAALNAKKALSKKGASKKAWKEEWHQTKEYLDWQANIKAHKGDDEAARAANAEEYARLRAGAFRIRDQLKAESEAQEETPKEETSSAAVAAGYLGKPNIGKPFGRGRGGGF